MIYKCLIKSVELFFLTLLFFVYIKFKPYFAKPNLAAKDQSLEIF